MSLGLEALFAVSWHLNLEVGMKGGRGWKGSGDAVQNLRFQLSASLNLSWQTKKEPLDIKEDR